ncbi:prepilin-type N-terminal cleavage/methylation domain-containing protein [Candidatus Minimicrobia sp. QA0096]|uniref:prepilin-type N-terminal cleavage/methylation domain-containing protein n=1 Tax=Candidatus Minimicrobia sp. QA0096 TaxID=3118470 RepID=UPI0030CAA180
MTTKNIKNQGFTLVELLIVIVIIAILTVVSLVAYNGLQNQAKTSAAKSAADAVAKKAELYNTAKSKYPHQLSDLTNKTVTDGTSSVSQTGEPYYLDESTVKTTTTALADGHAPGEANTIEYKPCPDTGDATGAHVKYYNFSTSKVEERTIGSCAS